MLGVLKRVRTFGRNCGEWIENRESRRVGSTNFDNKKGYMYN